MDGGGKEIRSGKKFQVERKLKREEKELEKKVKKREKYI